MAILLAWIIAILLFIATLWFTYSVVYWPNMVSHIRERVAYEAYVPHNGDVVLFAAVTGSPTVFPDMPSHVGIVYVDPASSKPYIYEISHAKDSVRVKNPSIAGDTPFLLPLAKRLETARDRRVYILPCLSDRVSAASLKHMIDEYKQHRFRLNFDDISRMCLSYVHKDHLRKNREASYVHCTELVALALKRHGLLPEHTRAETMLPWQFQNVCQDTGYFGPPFRIDPPRFISTS